MDAPSAAPSTSPSTHAEPVDVEEKITKLNIGGYRYMTTRETLLKKNGDNFFTSLLSGRYSAVRDEKGFYFIDRDGEYFRPILEYLRTGEYYLPKGMHPEAVAREAQFYSLTLPSPGQLKRSPSMDLRRTSLCFHGFYLPMNIRDQRGIVSNAAVISFRKDGTGHFSDAKNFHFVVRDTTDLVVVTITCNHLPYNFLLLEGNLSDGSSEFRFYKPEPVMHGVYYHGYIAIPETDITAILFGEKHVFLRFSKRVLVKVERGEKSSVNAALFSLKKADDFLGFPTLGVDITICKAASLEVQETHLQLLSFGEFLLARDHKSNSCSFYVFNLLRVV